MARPLDKQQRDTAMSLLSDEQRAEYLAMGEEAVVLEGEAMALRRKADHFRWLRSREKSILKKTGAGRDEAAKQARAKFNGKVKDHAARGARAWKNAQRKRAEMDRFLRAVLRDARACGVLAEMKRASAVAAPRTQRRSA